MSMHNPAMYQKYISFQKRDALNMLKMFANQMKWRNNASVIDIGCGDGFVTCNVLKKHLPTDYNRLVGVDISKEMIEHARMKYGDEKTSFMVMDIGGKVPKELEQGFDHAFSSYALQFVSNEKKSFSNINSVLKNGGSCLLLFSGRNNITDVFLAMANTTKWEKWLKKDILKILLRYHKIKGAAGDVERIMVQTGFKNIHVEENKICFDYESLDHLIKMIESANLFHMPSDVLREFVEDMEKVFVDIKAIERPEGQPEAARLGYHQLIAYGTK